MVVVGVAVEEWELSVHNSATNSGIVKVTVSTITTKTGGKNLQISCESIGRIQPVKLV